MNLVGLADVFKFVGTYMYLNSWDTMNINSWGLYLSKFMGEPMNPNSR